MSGVSGDNVELSRPWCCPEPRCTPVHQVVGDDPNLAIAQPGESFICFGKNDDTIEFMYDHHYHRNDLRSCSYTPLKGVVANQENADDWRAIANAYKKALDAIGGWSTPSIKQVEELPHSGRDVDAR